MNMLIKKQLKNEKYNIIIHQYTCLGEKVYVMTKCGVPICMSGVVALCTSVYVIDPHKWH